jgi:hypothetical protein
MKQLSMWFGILLFAILSSACSTTKEAEMETKDELADFRSWVDNATSNIADKTEEEWKSAKSEFKSFTDEIDQKQDKFSAEVSEEYNQLKQKFNDADTRYMEGSQQRSQTEWQNKLLGKWSDMSTINEYNVQEAYVTFMENVRQHKGTWSNNDWQMAKMVLESLNKHKDGITGNIATDTQIKIKALQMEFRTLETAADVGGNN